MQPRTDISRTALPDLIAQARQGDPTELLRYLSTRFTQTARYLCSGYRFRSQGMHLSAEDLVQEALERSLLSLDKALAGDHPIEHLLCTGTYRMQDVCQEQRASIRVPARSQRRGQRIPFILSLDAPLPGTDGLTLAELIPQEGGNR
jgi:DNA-directed RNA polymerase specialized sigma24 family protein